MCIIWDMPRRRANSLRPIEVEILAAGAAFAEAGSPEFHGFAAAKAIERATGKERLTATGTLYRALHRLEGFGCLTSRWEDPGPANEEGRPQRKLYQLTAVGEAALAKTEAEERGQEPVTRPEVQLS